MARSTWRRLERAGGAGRAGGGADADLVQQQQDGLALDVLEADVGGVGQAVVRVAVDADVRAPSPGCRPPACRAARRTRVFSSIEVGRRQLAGRAQADDVRHVLGAAAAVALLVPADDERGQAGALADVEHADALGRVQLVAGEGEQVDGAAGHVHRHLADGLHGVGVEDRRRAALTISAISSMGKITPVSLLAHMTETTAVSGRMALARARPGRARPSPSTPSYVTSIAALLQVAGRGSSTAGCSTRVVMMCRLSGLASSDAADGHVVALACRSW